MINLKRILHFIFIIIINGLLSLIALFIYHAFTKKMISRTEDYGIEPVIFLLGLIAFFIFMISSKSKFIKTYCVGMFFISISLFMLLLFFLNKELATEGPYRMFRLRNKEQIGDRYFLNIAFSEMYTITEVPKEKYVLVDSVYLRVDKGLFGMEVYSDNVKIDKNRKWVPLPNTDTTFTLDF
jgi:hypothetical protein